MAQDKLVHVVDDDDAVRRSLDFMLRSAGYKVERWEDGVSFLKGVDRAQPACVLLDVRMPGMDGLEVQAAMAEQRHQPAGDRAHRSRRCLDRGAGHAGRCRRLPLEKPFNRERLLNGSRPAKRTCPTRRRSAS